jgi:hypothetical protein
MILTVMGNRVLTFNGCKAVIGKAPELEPCNKDCNTCDITKRDIELVEIAELIPYVVAETAYYENGEILYADKNIVEQQIAWTLTDFTKQTMILERVSTIKQVKGQSEYLIVPPMGETIHKVTSICIDGNCIDAIKNGTCLSQSKNNRFSFYLPNKIKVFDCGCKDIVVNYTTFSSNTACTIDKLIVDRYQEAITFGAAGRVRKMAGFPWSSPQKGLDLLREYQSTINQYKLEQAEMHINKSGTVNTFGNVESVFCNRHNRY